MYASKPDKFLFIKSTKTAGTSLEIALSIVLASRAEQFFTPISFRDELLRIHLSDISYTEKMKDVIPSINTRKLKEVQYIPEDVDQTNLNSLKEIHLANARKFVANTGFANHTPYSRCLENFPEFNKYWSCVFARHPYRRFLSHLAFRAKKFDRSMDWSLSEWRTYAEEEVSIFCKRSLKYFSYDPKSQTSVNAVLAYEKLKESTKEICQKLSLPEELLFNSMPFTKHKPFSVLKNMDPNDLLIKSIKSKILEAEEYLFDGLGYKDSSEDFMPATHMIES